MVRSGDAESAKRQVPHAAANLASPARGGSPGQNSLPSLLPLGNMRSLTARAWRPCRDNFMRQLALLPPLPPYRRGTPTASFALSMVAALPVVPHPATQPLSNNLLNYR
jgi:hypothetical protein